MTTFGDRLYQLGGAPVGGDLLGLSALVQVRYLDPNSGSDGHSGKKPDQAYKTLQYSLDQLGAYTSDDGTSAAYPGGRAGILIRLPGTEEVSATVMADQGPNITVVAATAGQMLFGDRLLAYTVAASGFTSGPVLHVKYRNVSLYGLAWGGRATAAADDPEGSAVRYTADSTVTGIQTGGGGQFFTVRDNLFRDVGGNDGSGLYLHGAGPAMIYQNHFGYAAAALGPVGITLRGSATNNPTDIRIQENYFLACPVGIRMSNATIQSIIINNNWFNGNSDSLHFGTGLTATVGTIQGNYFDTTTGAASWLNDGGSGQSAANVTTDTGITFSGNNFSA